MSRLRSLSIYAIVLVALIGLCGPTPAIAGSFPFELTKENETPLLAAGGLLGLAAIGIQSDLPGISADELAQLDSQNVNRFDRSATRRWSPGANTASNWLERSLVLLPLLLALTDEGLDEPTTILTMHGETILLTNGVVQLIKGTVRRTRPYAYNDHPSISEKLKQSKKTRRSFPSGHAANTFAAAVFTSSLFEKMYPTSKYDSLVWGTTLAAATATGYFRYAAGRHYPTDILVGAALGAAIGFLVPEIHKIKSDNSDKANTIPILTFGFTF